MSDDQMQLDREFILSCCRQAERLLVAFIENPVNSALQRQMMTVFLQRQAHMTMLLNAVIVMHNRNIAEYPFDAGLLDPDLGEKLGMLAHAIGQEMEGNLFEVDLKFDLEAKTISINAQQPQPPQEDAPEGAAPDVDAPTVN